MLPIYDFKSDALQQMTQEVDAIIVRSVTAGDPLIACEYGNAIRSQAAIRGLALAKLLYEMEKNWEFYVAAGIEDEFEIFIEVQMGISQQTTRKYTTMWRNIFASDFVSPEIKQKLQSKPIQELLLLTSAVEEGSLTDEELETIAVSDRHRTREIIKQARGEQTSSRTAVVGSIQMRDGRYPRGTIIATREGESETVGFLNLDLDNNSAGAKLVARIRNASGLVERD